MQHTMRLNAHVWIALASFCWAACLAAAGDLRLVDAVRNGNAKAVRSLLEQHADVNAAQPDGATALAWAANRDDGEMVDLLIGAGAKVNAANEYGETALTLACANGDAAIVEKLLKAGANPNATRWTGETPLMIAAGAGSIEAVKLLLARGVDVNAKESRHGQTALMWTIAEKHPEITRVLVEHGADVRASSKGGFTPLLFAAQQGDVESARTLVAAGADVNSAMPDGTSPLMVAAAGAREALGKFLLDKGAQPNVKDSAGVTPLHSAAQSGQVELVRTLVSHAADLNASLTKNPRGTPAAAGPLRQLNLAGATPFLLAARAGHVEVMRVLSAGGANTALRTQDGTTAVMAAAASGDLPSVQLAVELGGDVNALNQNRQNAIHYAVTNFTGTVDQINAVIQFLAEKGAKLDVKDSRSQTPLSISERRTIDRTADLLRKLIANPPH